MDDDDNLPIVERINRRWDRARGRVNGHYAKITGQINERAKGIGSDVPLDLRGKLAKHYHMFDGVDDSGDINQKTKNDLLKSIAGLVVALKERGDTEMQEALTVQFGIYKDYIDGSPSPLDNQSDKVVTDFVGKFGKNVEVATFHIGEPYLESKGYRPGILARGLQDEATFLADGSTAARMPDLMKSAEISIQQKRDFAVRTSSQQRRPHNKGFHP